MSFFCTASSSDVTLWNIKTYSNNQFLPRRKFYWSFFPPELWVSSVITQLQGPLCGTKFANGMILVNPPVSPNGKYNIGKTTSPFDERWVLLSAPCANYMYTVYECYYDVPHVIALSNSGHRCPPVDNFFRLVIIIRGKINIKTMWLGV